MTRPRVFDTSVFVQTIRGQLDDQVLLHHAFPGRTYLCAVVAHELWVGTRSRDDAEALRRLLRGFERLGSVLTPSYEDWTLAGRLLEQYQRLFGKITPTDHVRHMDRWARLARRSGRQVRVREVD